MDAFTGPLAKISAFIAFTSVRVQGERFISDVIIEQQKRLKRGRIFQN